MVEGVSGSSCEGISEAGSGGGGSGDSSPSKASFGKSYTYETAIHHIRGCLEQYRSGESGTKLGASLMYRVLASEPELEMLSEMEGVEYAYVPGMHVDYITPEVKSKIREVYLERVGSKNAGVDACADGCP